MSTQAQCLEFLQRCHCQISTANIPDSIVAFIKQNELSHSWVRLLQLPSWKLIIPLGEIELRSFYKYHAYKYEVFTHYRCFASKEKKTHRLRSSFLLRDLFCTQSDRSALLDLQSDLIMQIWAYVHLYLWYYPPIRKDKIAKDSLIVRSFKPLEIK